MTTPAPARPSTARRNRLLLIGFGVLALLGILIPAVFDKLLAGDERQLVVTLKPGVTFETRDALKADCGGLPGVSLVPDQGAPERQARLPVRFRIAGSTPTQEAALEVCIKKHSDIVRGVLTEGDAT